MTIHVEYNADTDLYDMVVSVPGMGPTPCGNRIFHIPPQMKPGAVPDWPQVQFSHQTQEAAEMDAEKIRKYISELKPATKKQTAKFQA